MIDHVMLMNLKRREDKFYFALGALKAASFSFSGNKEPWGDTIIRFISHDALDYKDTQAVVKAAAADGFDYFERYTGDSDDQTTRFMAWRWTWISALRTIVDMDKCVMLLIDDFIPLPGWTWQRFKRLVKECHEASSSFKALQLKNNSRAEMFVPPVDPYTSMLRPGFCGANNNGFVLKKDGAQRLLEVHKELFPTHGITEVCRTISERGENDANYRDGFWSVLEPVIDLGYFGWVSDLWK